MRKIIITSLIAIIFSSVLYSQQKHIISVETVEVKLPFGLIDQAPKNKPKLAFALSGGGARGLSQIGIIKALEEADIKPDIIVGTSMGSIVGGMYAAGYTTEQMDSIAKNTDWNDLLTLSSQSNRRDLFVEQKVTEDRAILSLRLDGLKPVIPTSFNDGQKLSNYLNLIAFNAPTHPDDSFDRLKIKFRAVCTDLISGNEVILDKGSLSNALRASSSVTFFLSPIKLDSLLLVDGGLIANIPVDIAKQHGGDFVVAFNTTSPLWAEENLSVPWIIADQIISIPMRLNNNDQLSKADFILEPKIDNIRSTDFDKADTLINLGYISAKNITKELKEKIEQNVFNSFKQKEKIFYNLLLSTEITESEKKILLENSDHKSISNKLLNYNLYKLFETGNYKLLSVEITEFSDRCELDLKKQENPLVKDVDIIGVSVIPSDKISKIFTDIKNSNYSAKIISDRLIKLIELYRTEGYSLAEIQSVEFNQEENRLKIFVDEGIISRIDVEGNEKTNKGIITREFRFKEGDYFKIKDVEDGLKNLRSTKLFENIDLSVQEEKGQNILTIKVTEKPSSLLRLNFRSDNEYRLQIGLDLRDENIFGTGSELGFTFFGGLENRTFAIDQKANRIFNTYFTYKINAYYSFRDISVYENTPSNDDFTFSREEIGKYRQLFYGLSFGVGTQVGRFGNLIFEGKYQFDEIRNIKNDIVSPYKTKIVSLKISTTIDTQDKYPFPEDGVFFTGFYETAQSVLGGELGFSRIGFEYHNYFSVFKDHVVSPKIEFGFGDKTLPLSQQFSLGGQESFFGMREFDYRGRQIFLGSLMYRYKLPIAIFFDTYFKIRYDLGSIWSEQEQIRFKDLRHGIGSSLAFDTPIGPAEFAVGRSFLLKKEPIGKISWGDVLFYFSIGYYY